jgi:hypothetical protein
MIIAVSIFLSEINIKGMEIDMGSEKSVSQQRILGEMQLVNYKN